MTIKFSIRHHYKDVPIEITIEGASIDLLSHEIENTILWLIEGKKLIDKLYEQTRKLTEKEKEEKP